MGEYLHCAPGQQLPLVLGARDLQLKTAFGAAAQGLPESLPDELASPQPPTVPINDVPSPSGPSAVARTKSRLQFESFSAGPPAAAELSQPQLPALPLAPKPADPLAALRRSPSSKQMMKRLTTQREVALLRIYQVRIWDLFLQPDPENMQLCYSLLKQFSYVVPFSLCVWNKVRAPSDSWRALSQVLSPSLVSRARIFGSALVLQDQWVGVDDAYFDAPGEISSHCATQRGGMTRPQVTLIWQDLMSRWGKLEIEGLAICSGP